MEPFGILLKSYAPDLPLAERFIASWQKFAQDPIPIAVVVPDSDLDLFSHLSGDLITLVPESRWSHLLVNERIHGNSPGYINQQIIKLAFGKIGMFENYLCADSDAQFLRAFSRRDFMVTPDVPYTFVSLDLEVHVDPTYFHDYWRSREQQLLRIRDFFDLPRTPYVTCHNMAVFSESVLAELRAFLDERSLEYSDLMRISPYEFSWYNFFLESQPQLPRVTREPIFLMVHQAPQLLSLNVRQIGEEDISRGYVGIVINSGFSREHGVQGLDEPLTRTLGRYVNFRDLGRGVKERILRRLPRVRRLLHL